MQSLYSAVKIGEEKVTIDPLTLFLRLIVMVEKKSDEEIASYFEYQLSPYPMSLFKDGVMRSSQKSKLKYFLLVNISTIDEDTCETIKIADGGALLWCCNWNKNQSFQTISKMYADVLCFLRSLLSYSMVICYQQKTLLTKNVLEKSAQPSRLKRQIIAYRSK